MNKVAIVGTGFVADLYMASFRTMPTLKVVGAYDIDHNSLHRFSQHWNVPAFDSLDSLLFGREHGPYLVLNLTNPASHYEISHAALNAGKHVYSEKPLAMTFEHCRELVELAVGRNLQIASAPCSLLGQTAQTLWKAVKGGTIGKPRLIYAELDDDYVPLAPYRKWLSESGKAWPAGDEFSVGCTLEHEGYYLTWLMAMFGPVRTVVAASASVHDPQLLGIANPAPDFSSATLFFEGGMVARLTCSIVAPHDHSIKIIGDGGVLSVHDCWNNQAPVYLRRRHVIRRRLLNSPFARRITPTVTPHQEVARRGAASMNFALGPAEMMEAISAGKASRLSGDFALHLSEVSLAISEAGAHTGAVRMRSSFAPIQPMPWSEG